MSQSPWIRFVGVVALAGLPAVASAGPPATAPPAPASTRAPAAAAAPAEKEPGLDQEALRNQALSALDRDDPVGCASLAAEGAKLAGRYREELFGLQGICLVSAGDAQGAVAAYTEGLRRLPASAALHYNLAVTHLGLKALPEALVHAKAAVQSEPSSARDHGFLGLIYGQLGEKTPALLARLRALSLETQGPVAGSILISLLEQLTDGVSKDGRERKVTLQLGPPSAEGDFRTYQIIEGTIKHRELERVGHGGKDDFPALRQQLVAILQALAEEKPDAGFARLYYLPFFIELKAKGHLETFSYALFTMGAAKDKGLALWLKKHPQQLKRLSAWAQGYRHPAPAAAPVPPVRE